MVVSTFLRLSVCRSYTVIIPLSAFSATATNLRLAEMAKLEIPSVSGEPGINFWAFCSMWYLQRNQSGGDGNGTVSDDSPDTRVPPHVNRASCCIPTVSRVPVPPRPLLPPRHWSHHHRDYTREAFLFPSLFHIEVSTSEGFFVCCVVTYRTVLWPAGYSTVDSST